MADNTVNQSTLESLSALVDNQASELELHRLLKQIESDVETGSQEGSTEIRKTWARYQLSSAAMRRELPSGDYIDLSARIRTAIDEEPAHNCPANDYQSVTAGQDKNQEANKPQQSWWSSVGRFAIAASVAGAVVLGAQQYNAQLTGAGLTGGNEVAEAPVSTQAVPMPAGFNAPSLNARTVSSHDRYEPNLRESRKVIFVPRNGEKTLDNSPAKREIQNHLNQLMLEHAEHAALNSGRGMLPFARVARMEEE